MAAFWCKNCGHQGEAGAPCSNPICRRLGLHLINGRSPGAATDPFLGRCLSERWVLVERIGAGGFAHVYMAIQRPLGNRVAIKLLHGLLAMDSGPQRAEALARFDREARVMAQLSHPNIVSFHTLGMTDMGNGGTPFLVMELIEGGVTLSKRLKHDRLTDSEVRDIFGDVLHALSAAHSKNFVHRDLKPGNIMLVSGRAKLLDFGLTRACYSARQASDAVTEAFVFMGTAAYAAPEQMQSITDIDAVVDHRADLYTVGLMLYEAWVGHRAWRHRDSRALMSAKLHQPTLPLEQESVETLDEDVQRFLTRALSFEPESRFQSAAEMREALDHICLPRMSRALTGGSSAVSPRRAVSAAKAETSSMRAPLDTQPPSPSSASATTPLERSSADASFESPMPVEVTEAIPATIDAPIISEEDLVGVLEARDEAVSAVDAVPVEEEVISASGGKDEAPAPSLTPTHSARIEGGQSTSDTSTGAPLGASLRPRTLAMLVGAMLVCGIIVGVLIANLTGDDLDDRTPAAEASHNARPSGAAPDLSSAGAGRATRDQLTSIDAPIALANSDISTTEASTTGVASTAPSRGALNDVQGALAAVEKETQDADAEAAPQSEGADDTVDTSANPDDTDTADTSANPGAKDDAAHPSIARLDPWPPREPEAVVLEQRALCESTPLVKPCVHAARVYALPLWKGHDLAAALSLYQTACDRGAVEACFERARLALLTAPNTREEEAPLSALMTLCQQGSAAACLTSSGHRGTGAELVALASGLCAQSGDATACAVERTGVLAQSGLSRIETRRVHLDLTEACESEGVEIACLGVGLSLIYGEDLEQGGEVLLASCERGFLDSCVGLTEIIKDLGEEGYISLATRVATATCEFGVVEHCRFAAWQLSDWRHKPRPDPGRALDMLEMACLRGAGSSCTGMAKLIHVLVQSDRMKNLDPRVTRDALVGWNLKGCDLDEGWGCFAAGSRMHRSEPAKALPLLEKSCRLGVEDGCSLARSVRAQVTQ